MNNSANKTSYKVGHAFIPGGEKGWFKKGVPNNVEDKHPAWKGADASYSSIHKWVVRKKGSASLYPCVDCGKESNGKRFHWSNISHKYLRDLNDYITRCISCHKKYDNKK